MIKMPLYNKTHREFYKFFREERNIELHYADRLLSGQGLVRIADFLATKMDEGQKYSASPLLKAKALEAILPEDITTYAHK
mmetsp:Transcript_14442/g.10412  ORF Transcript_14442/g.10412 Transcript_14442/m.10412 type:complete len:81 (-) Transcript_14442:336-578(-)|eukprot:CAMPEP_0202963848 /NCGR_PEP_ID=MMETSP1396-20130829/7884_1 /ASSEMBLY_ACC=CAM_ASM_000872 /TAXON_ID= /ORGANISM="Pseudokeronopsis sp., Strain Brazil" /LENGTH=80 /DNA_ID=CAMNT_0049685431 /DNA_START=523 /DNA_END=765 /DNA_ORIENTATION=+